MSQSEYSEQGFWQKLKMFALKAGQEVVEKALWLFYAAQRPDTPK
ncbi:MAG: YkvA family protein, partial [Shewanella sp.]